jgi:hypothetical protein
MLLLLLGCADGPISDTGAPDDTASGGDTADTARAALACPDGWLPTFTLVDDDCGVGTTVASGGAIVCKEDGTFRVPWVDGTLLTLSCPTSAALACDGDNKGAWWENTVVATGSLTATSLSADWSVTMTWSNDEGATTETCTTTGTVTAAP